MQQWLTMLRAGWLAHWIAWAVFAAYLAGAWLGAQVARRLARAAIPRLTARTRTFGPMDDRLIRSAEVPVFQAVFALGVRLALQVLGSSIPSIGQAATFDWIQKAAAAVTVLALANLANGLVKAALDWYIRGQSSENQRTLEYELVPVVRRLVSLVVYFIALSIILDDFGQNITALVTTAGIASLAVALAAQETLSNMLGGFAILVDRPFKAGDTIELADGRSGEVIEIGIRSTRIKQADGSTLVVPNKDMANTRLVNFALPDPQAAVRIPLGVDYATDVERAKQVFLHVMGEHPDVLKEPAPAVHFTKFGNYSLDLLLVCWVESYKVRSRVTDQLNLALLKACRAEGINIPFPRQDLVLCNPELEYGGKPLENGEA